MEPSVLARTEDWARTILETLGVGPEARGTGGAPLTIGLDEATQQQQRKPASFGPDHPAVAFDNHDDAVRALPLRRPPSRRDSQRRREALLKGKEGSRQRRRWENDRLMHVPNAQPPLPSDWAVQPTHPVHYNLPYHVAQYWDKGLRQRVNEDRAAAAVQRRKQIVAQQSGTTAAAAVGGAGSTAAAAAVAAAAMAPPTTLGLVTRELRTAAKRTPAVKTWVRLLEEPVRQLLLAAELSRQVQEAEENRRTQAAAAENESDHYNDNDNDTLYFSDDEEEEIVFVGRRQLALDRAKEAAWKTIHRAVDRQQVEAGVVFDALGDDESGSFKRWLTHSVADYYGLNSRSATVDSPPRRIVYVTLRDGATRPESGPILVPRPMWELF
ncbi:hypothetical protein SPI_01328 [Niveomyces insectorum RCEF 264]|uniref:R3H-associated N-terminal domain-containing protein n=1 Tax=Niveomyces insectorum RCEF 264 TaxID=1081102 RepID=A0A162JC13_9HYPO|nr:hypothetical protein SPI_01328 [Niveomyces insectorum RCEF 264]